MKDYFNLKKSKLLLLTILAFFVGASPAWAQVTDDLTSYSATSSGQTLGDNWYVYPGDDGSWGRFGSDYTYKKASSEADDNYITGYSSNYTKNVWLVLKKEVSGEVSFRSKMAKNTGTLYVTNKVTAVGDGTFTVDKTGAQSYSITTTTASNTYDAGTSATYVAFCLASDQLRFLDVTYTEYVAISGPALIVKDGSKTIASGYSYPFGLATAGTEKEFTLSNPGTADLGVSVSKTGNFDATLSAMTIAAGGEVTLTVTMPDATGSSAVTITPDATSGIDPFIINVSGTIRDGSKVYEPLTSKPDDWNTTGTWSYGSTGATTTAWYLTSNARLYTPLLIVEEGEKFIFEVKGNYEGYQAIQVEYSTDATNWTASETSITVTSDWQTVEISDIPAGNYYIALHTAYSSIRNFYGGKLPEKPKVANFAIDANSYAFGMLNLNDVAQHKFTVTNSGTADMQVTFIPSDGVSVNRLPFLFTNNQNWTSVYVYAWDASMSALNSAWPGTEATQYFTNSYGEKVYNVVVPDGAVGIVVSNGSGAQTVDITDLTTYIGYYTSGSTDSQGHYVVTGYTDGEIGSFDNVIDGLTVAAGETGSFLVKMSTATAGAKNGTVALAFEAENATSASISLTGYVADDSKYYADFSGNALPEDWSDNTGWTFADGNAVSGTDTQMTLPAMIVADGEKMAISVMGTGSNSELYYYTSTDGGNSWSAKSANLASAVSTSNYSVVFIEGLTAGNYKIKLQGYHVKINAVNGFTKNPNDPKLAVATDATGENTVTSGTVCDFGWGTTNASATYYLFNGGKGTMTIKSINCDATGVTVATAGDAMTVTAGTPLALTVTMTGEGAHVGTISISTDGGDFTIPVTGFIRNADKLYLDFSADGAAFPAGWITGSWNISGNTAVASGDLQTTKLVAKAGDHMVIEAISTGSYYSTASLSYTILNADDNSELVASTAITSQLNTSTYSIIDLGEVSATEDANVIVKLTGSNVSVRRIYGFEAVAVAVMETTAANIAFGMQTAESAEQSFTISNTGEATLTGLSVTLGKTGDGAEYSFRMTDSEDAEFTGTELTAGQTITVYVKQLYAADNLGSKNDVLTIAADGQTAVTVNLTGATRDGSKLYVDFADNSWPEGWQHGSWSASYGEATSSTDYTSIVTTPLTVATGDKLSFDVKRSSSSATGRDLIVRYTTDGGVTWTAYDWSNYTWSATETLKDQITGSYNTFEITGIPAGTVAFEFSGKYLKLDNIVADYALTTAPLMALTTVSDNISGANLSADGVATYTLANNGNAAYVGTVAANNVNVAATGDDVTFEGNTLTVPAGKTATITATMAFAAPYGEKTGSLAITSESWVGDISASYTATLIDPTDFVIDFADNQKPAGWYSESASSAWSGWIFSNGDARISTGTAKPMITEKIGAEEGKNTLSFEAKAYSGDKQTLNVYTSTDRKNWGEAKKTVTLTADVQTVTLDALADGEYYVKFEASNAIIDNLTGVKKLEAPAHDLYEISTTMAASGTPGASYTATVVGVSLRADETVTAELWLEKEGNGTKVASLENQSMTVNTNKTFTLTGNLPTEEGTYEAWVTVKTGDSADDVYFNTDRITFTLEHTTSMAVNNLEPATSSVTADEDNQFTADFTVTLQNTGSKTLAANEVSVSITDDHTAEANVYTTKTAAQYIYVYPSEYTNDDAIIAVWNWSNTTDGEWVATTNMGSGLYIAELKKGKTNFSVVRINPAGTDENAWNNKWNQSVDLSTSAGNVFTFQSWGEGEGAKDNFTGSAFTLAAGETVVLPVSVTADAGEGGTFTFNAKENVTNTFYHNSYNRSVSVTAAPMIALSEDATLSAEETTYYRVTLDRPFIAGWNTLVLPFDVDAETFATKFGENAVLYTFAGNNNGELKFTKTTEGVKAGTPYLLNLTAVISDEMTFSKVGLVTTANDAADNGAEFKGNYVNGFDMEGKYGVTPAGQVKKGAAGSTMKAYRAYITMPAGQTARIAIFDETTGISRVLSAKELEGTDIFNMKGQRVSESAKGVVIINGKKVVIK